MPYFVTGACGFIGRRLCRKLASTGNRVVAFCRNGNGGTFAGHPQIKTVLGDVCDYESLSKAMQDCRRCFHLAGLARPWAKDRRDFYRVNVEGTRNVLESSLRCGVSKLVFTSTAGVYGPSNGSTMLDEISGRSLKTKTDYERTKHEAEVLVVDTARTRGLDACIVNPTRVFGPGPLNDANSLTRMIKQFAQGGWQIIPGSGDYLANYVFVDDVIEGHHLAMKFGVSGRNYILGSENLSFAEIVELVRRYSNSKARVMNVPEFGLFAYAHCRQAMADWVGVKPDITPAFVRKYFANYRISIDRAKTELNYSPCSVESGIEKTLSWIQRTSG